MTPHLDLDDDDLIGLVRFALERASLIAAEQPTGARAASCIEGLSPTAIYLDAVRAAKTLRLGPHPRAANVAEPAASSADPNPEKAHADRHAPCDWDIDFSGDHQ